MDYPIFFLGGDPLILAIGFGFYLLSFVLIAFRIKEITSRGQLLFLVFTLLMSVVIFMSNISDGYYFIAVPGVMLSALTLFKLLTCKIRMNEASVL